MSHQARAPDHSRVLLLAAYVVGISALIMATWRGIGITPDSLQYLSAGENVGAGRGLTSIGWDGDPAALTHFPPGYPLVLAAAAAAGWSLTEFARVANIVLFATTLTLVALITRRLANTGGSWWAATAAVVLCATAPDLLVAHSMAWSEPLYVTLTLGGLLALGTAVQRDDKRLLVLAGAAAAAAALVRYVGAANVAALTAVVALFWPTVRRTRLRLAVLAGALAAAPLLIALAATVDGPGRVANRRFAWHPLEFSDFEHAASVAVQWIAPINEVHLHSVLWLALIGFVVAVLLAARRKNAARPERSQQSNTLLRTLVTYAAAYVAVLVFSMSIVDAQTQFEPRLLVPLLVIAIMLGCAYLAELRGARGSPRAPRLALALVSLVVFANVARQVPWMLDATRHGLALGRMDPNAEALVSAARQLPPSARVYSNDPYFVRVHTGHAAAGLPRQRNPNSLLPNVRHSEQVREMCARAASQPTYVLLFEAPRSGDASAQAAEAIAAGDVEQLRGGRLIRVRPGCDGAVTHVEAESGEVRSTPQ